MRYAKAVAVRFCCRIVPGVIRSRGDSYVRQSSDWSRKQFLVSNFGRRVARPSPEGVVERGRALVAEQPRNLSERHPRILHVFERQALPQLIHNLLVSRALLSQSARERSLAEAQCLGDVLSPRLAVREQLLRLGLNQGSERPDRRAALFCSLIADGLERVEQVLIFSDQREGQRLLRECELNRSNNRSLELRPWMKLTFVGWIFRPVISRNALIARATPNSAACLALYLGRPMKPVSTTTPSEARMSCATPR
jgi:hypothetical protein